MGAAPKRSTIYLPAEVHRGLRTRIVPRIENLARAPRPPGSQMLAGEPERYRIHQDAYRIAYAVDDERRIVEVVKIGHRREVYR